MLTNRQTGETTIDGTEVTVLYTLEAIAYVESQLDARIMESWSQWGEGRVGIRDLVVLITGGMEGHRRRHGMGGGQTNPAKAQRAIEDGGGLRKVFPQVFEALTRSQALGLVDVTEAEDEQSVDPTTGGSSSGGSTEQDWPRIAAGS